MCQGVVPARQLIAAVPSSAPPRLAAWGGYSLIWLVGDFNNQSHLAAYNTLTNQLRTFTSASFGPGQPARLHHPGADGLC